MTSRADHFRKAEEQLAAAHAAYNRGQYGADVQYHLGCSQVHAILAACPQEVIHEVLDVEGEAALAAQEQEWAKDWPRGGQMSDEA